MLSEPTVKSTAKSTVEAGSSAATVSKSVSNPLWARLGTLAPALRTRNFRLFWLGQMVSVVGTSVQVVAEGWLIYDLTGSTFWLGMVGLLGLLPVLPVSIFGGLLIDRVSRRRLILITQVLLMAQALLFGLLAWSGQIQLWQIIGLYFLFGAILAIDHPARRAFLVDLVGREELANAVALNATLFNFSSLIGYGLAGVLIAVLGVGVTMMFNGLTYLAPIVALLLIRLIPKPAATQETTQPASGAPTSAPTSAPTVESLGPIGSGEQVEPVQSTPVAHPPPAARPRLHVALLEGVVSLWKQPAVLGVMSLMAVVGGLAYPVFGMMPAFAESVLQVGARGLGLLMAAGALGSVLGTIVVARVGNRQRGRVLALTAIALPLLMIAFSQVRIVWLVCLLLVGIGAAILVLQSLAVTIVQIQTADGVRGRVMTLYSQLHAGADTLGNVGVGALAVYLGLPIALVLAAGAALVYAVVLRARVPSVAGYD